MGLSCTAVFPLRQQMQVMERPLPLPLLVCLHWAWRQIFIESAVKVSSSKRPDHRHGRPKLPSQWVAGVFKWVAAAGT